MLFDRSADFGSEYILKLILIIIMIVEMVFWTSVVMHVVEMRIRSATPLSVSTSKQCCCVGRQKNLPSCSILLYPKVIQITQLLDFIGFTEFVSP